MIFKVETQGISLDYTTGNGDYESIDRGMMNQEQLLEVLNRVRNLEDPAESHPNEDLCPPHVLVLSDAGQYSFTVAGSGDFYNVETDAHVSPIEAAAMAAGGGMQPPPQRASASNLRSSQSSPNPGPPPSQRPPKRGFFAKIGRLILLFVMIIVGLAIYAAVFDEIDDTGGFITCGIVVVLWWIMGRRKSRRGSVAGYTATGATGYYAGQHMYMSGHDENDDNNDSDDGDWGGSDDSGSDD